MSRRLRWMSVPWLICAGCGAQPASSGLHFPTCIDATLPFQANLPVKVAQGYHASNTHHGSYRYALDFDVPEGTPVLAARSGRAVAIKEDSTSGCNSSTCATQGNYVIVDHGDGTLAEYYHLSHQGADVQVGDAVCQGQVIGRSGNTGWSSGPHLHLRMFNLVNDSLPICFDHIAPRIPSGILFAGAVVHSYASSARSCGVPAYSECNADTFRHRGIVLTRQLPCTHVESDQTYVIEGYSLAPSPWVQVATWSGASDEWTYRCVQTDASGRFQTEIRWNPGQHRAPDSYFQVSAAERDCSAFNGWRRSVRVWPHPLAAPEEAPPILLGGIVGEGTLYMAPAEEVVPTSSHEECRGPDGPAACLTEPQEDAQEDEP